ncbi:MAG TPA: glycosyltransferase family 39 protein [Anaerolineales bacterium]|nr:glycosyltransferase family 39 protein [Anaerolineales bacterium]
MNRFLLPLLLREPLTTLQAVSVQFLLNQSLFAMAALQLLWLLLIPATGASTKYDTILVVATFSIVATFLVILLPVRAIPKLKDLKSCLVRSERGSLLFLCLAAMLIGFLYALRHSAGGDELSSLKAANIIASEGIVAAYKRVGWLGEQHPPLLPILFALTSKLPGPDLLLMRMVSNLFLAGAVAVTYLLGRELYNRETGFLAATLLLSFPLVIRLSASPIMDIQLAFFFSLALLLCLRLSRKPSYPLACAAGVVIGLGLLSKYIMVLVFVVLFLCIFFLSSFRAIKSHLLVAAMVSLSIFALWLLYASQIGILDRQIQKILNFTGIYHVTRNLREAALSRQPAAPEVASGDADPAKEMQNGIFRLGLETLFTRLPSSFGAYHAPLILFGLLYLVKKRDVADSFLLLWIGGVSISLFLTLPDHRYFLSVFPAIAMAIARVQLKFPESAERAVLLSLLFGASNLYLFANWVRESHLFIVMP